MGGSFFLYLLAVLAAMYQLDDQLLMCSIYLSPLWKHKAVGHNVLLIRRNNTKISSFSPDWCQTYCSDRPGTITQSIHIGRTHRTILLLSIFFSSVDLVACSFETAIYSDLLIAHLLISPLLKPLHCCSLCCSEYYFTI